MRYETKKLIEAYEKHGQIIVGVDFDNTVFPLDDSRSEYCCNVVDMLRSIESVSLFCLYTVSSDQEIIYKKFIMEHHYDISIKYVNESPIILGNGAKPYFNILLDDKAGLNEAIEILKEFKNHLKL